MPIVLLLVGSVGGSAQTARLPGLYLSDTSQSPMHGGSPGRPIFVSSAGRREFPHNSLAVQLSRLTVEGDTGMSTQRHVVLGAAVGAVGGALIGVQVAKNQFRRCHCERPGLEILVYPPIGAIVGGALGGLIGYLLKW